MLIAIYSGMEFSVVSVSHSAGNLRGEGTMDEADVDPCRSDYVEHTRQLFVDVAQQGAIATGERPARRAVFRKTHGVASGTMVLDQARPKELRQGIFAGDRYLLGLRFSSDVAPDADDADNGTIGVAIKLFGVTPPTLAEIDPGAPTADLILQNHDVFFVDTGYDMCVFTDLALKGKIEDWFRDHPDTRQILADMAKREDSVLAATYFSVLPYAFGAERTVKYRLRPLQAGPSRAPITDRNRLATDFAERLAAGSAAFAFEIQVPATGKTLPIDQATSRWSEEDAPFVPVATVEIPQQDVGREGQQAYGDTLAFSPWRVPEANRPLGSIAESRRRAYPSSAALRHYVNGTPEAEPHMPRKS